MKTELSGLIADAIQLATAGLIHAPPPTLSGFPLVFRQKARRAYSWCGGSFIAVRLAMKHFLRAAGDPIIQPLDAAERAAEMIGVDRIQATPDRRPRNPGTLGDFAA